MKKILPYFFVAAHTASIIILFILYINFRYENKIIDHINSKVISSKMTDKEQVLTLLNASHRLLERRARIFSDRIPGLRSQILNSTDRQLLEAPESCGSYTHVLARLLQRSGHKIRITQMLCKNKNDACHILLEVNLNDKWVVIDPFYNLAFTTQYNELASFSEVSKNWDYFKKQTPKNYNPLFSYDGVRYTNWNKIPIIMPTIKKVLHLFIGGEVEYISLRTHLLSLYFVYFISLLIAYFILILLTIIFIVKCKNPIKKDELQASPS